MPTIVLRGFGGMMPRRGEQHLDSNHATDAVNANLYSGELRPLNKPSLAHTFCRPDEPCYLGPKPIVPPPVRPPIPEDCHEPVIITQPIGNGSDGEPCKVYECDAYGNFLTGAAQYYWPADTRVNNVSDGYLAGTPFNISLQSQNGWSSPHNLIPDACNVADGWKVSAAQGTTTLDATDMMPFQYQQKFIYSMVYRNGGGTSDNYLGDFRFQWKTPTPGFGNILIFKPFVQNDLIGIQVGGNQTTPGFTVDGAISDPENETHVLTWEMTLHPETILDGDDSETTVVLYVDWVEVGRKTIFIETTKGKGDAVYYPAPKEEAGGGGPNMWLINSSCDNFFSHIAIMGGVSIGDAKDAWDRNKADYVDPDPTCGVGVAIPGTQVTFSVEVSAESTGPLQYQWYKAGAPLAGETGATLTMTLMAEDDGKYLTVLVIGPCGEDLSDSALITVDTEGTLPPECVPYSCEAYEASLIEQGVVYNAAWSTSPDPGDMPFPFTKGPGSTNGIFDMWGWYIAGPVRHYQWGGALEIYDCSGIAGSETSPTLCEGDVNRCLLIEANSSQTAMTPTKGDGQIGIWGNHHIEQVFAYHTGELARNCGSPWLYEATGTGGYRDHIVINPNVYCWISRDGTDSILTLSCQRPDGETDDATINLGNIDGKWNHATYTAGSTAPVVYPDPDRPGYEVIEMSVWATASVNGKSISVTGGNKWPGFTAIVNHGPYIGRLLYEGPVYYRQATAIIQSINNQTFTDSPPDTYRSYVAFLRNYEDYVPPAWCPIV